jgi:hypothetical protein
MHCLHIVPASDGRFPSFRSILPKLFPALLFAAASSVSAAPTVGVGSAVNCPGAYLQAGTGKVCQANPDYKDIIYIGENSRKSCKFPYTRVNAGDSKWCVTYPDP